MKTYQVEVQETLSRIFEVEATSADDAVDIIRRGYSECLIVLSADDFVEAEFSVYEANSFN